MNCLLLVISLGLLMVPVLQVSAGLCPAEARKGYIKCVKQCAEEPRCRTIEEDLPGAHDKTVTFAHCSLNYKDREKCQACLHTYRQHLREALEAVELELEATYTNSTDSCRPLRAQEPSCDDAENFFEKDDFGLDS